MNDVCVYVLRVKKRGGDENLLVSHVFLMFQLGGIIENASNRMRGRYTVLVSKSNNIC